MAKSFSVEVGDFVEVPSVMNACDVISIQSPKNRDDGNILIVRDTKGNEFDVCEAWVKVLATAKK
jgi:hypothetical protein